MGCRTAGIVVLAVLIVGLARAAPAAAEARVVQVLTVNGEIEPAMAQYVETGIRRASEQRADAVVIRLYTPGGLSSSMEQIIDAILQSRAPVIVYVSPTGARAASAGTFITMAAHIAAMAPATRIGSAHPVFASPLPTSEQPSGGQNTMMQKVVNDAVSYIVSLAKKRGRNADWARDAVVKSANLTAEDAVKLHVVDFIAQDMGDLLAKSDGRKVDTAYGTVTVHTKGARLDYFEMPWYKMFLHYLANPLIAFFLMLAAVYGIIFEINNPGAIAPGVIGGVALILLLYSFSVLPINVAGLVLILLSIVLFILDIKVPTHGALTIGGIVAFFLGSMMVFGSAAPGVGVPLAVLAAGTIATAGFFAFLVGMGARALRRPVVTGRYSVVGLVVEAKTDINPVGKVFAQGAWWTAETEGQPVKKGESVRIVGMKGLRLMVTRADVV